MKAEKTSFYSEEELSELGLKSYGVNVKISRYARIYSPHSICIGDNVRIDDFCILSGKITLGSNIHISAYVALYGTNGIILKDYSGISPKSVVYSAMDDFSGDYLVGPIHPDDTTNVTGGPVVIEQYVQVGSNTVVFPNLTIGEGSVIGGNVFLTKSVPAGTKVHVANQELKFDGQAFEKNTNEDDNQWFYII